MADGCIWLWPNYGQKWVRAREARTGERTRSQSVHEKLQLFYLGFFFSFLLVFFGTKRMGKTGRTGTWNFFLIYLTYFADTAKTDLTFLSKRSYFQHPSLHRFCCQILYKMEFYRLVMQALWNNKTLLHILHSNYEKSHKTTLMTVICMLK